MLLSTRGAVLILDLRTIVFSDQENVPWNAARQVHEGRRGGDVSPYRSSASLYWHAMISPQRRRNCTSPQSGALLQVNYCARSRVTPLLPIASGARSRSRCLTHQCGNRSSPIYATARFRGTRSICHHTCEVRAGCYWSGKWRKQAGSHPLALCRWLTFAAVFSLPWCGLSIESSGRELRTSLSKGRHLPL